MNFKYINRKQRLGISHPDDFSQWAGTWAVEHDKAFAKDNEYLKKRGGKIVPDLGRLADGDYAIWEDFTPMQMQRTLEWFNASIDALALDFKHCEVEDTFFTETVQVINSEARKQEFYFNIIDLRPISELGKNLGETEVLDKMVVECGCNPLGDYWIEYSPEDGRQTLQVIFEFEVMPGGASNLKPSGNNVLANQFLACFDDSVRFYGNSSYAPWDHKSSQKPYIQSKFLQSCHRYDFGLVLRDNKHIGFLLLTGDI